MKIAILSTLEIAEWAATEEVWTNFARYALENKCEVIAAVNYKVARSSQVKEMQELGLEIVQRHPFRPVRLYLLKEYFVSDMRRILQFKPDVLLISSGSLYDIINLPYLLNFCNKVKVEKVFFCHGVSEINTTNKLNSVRAFFATVKKNVFVCNHNKLLAERQLATSFKNSLVIINAPKKVFEHPLPLPQTETIQFACVARLDFYGKGHDLLLDVLSKDKWGCRNWHLNLYGEGPDKQYISDLIGHYNLTDRVTIHGHVNNIEKIWNENHLMLLATRGEGTSLAILEAMMCGRPVVTTDVGGNREILVEGETGWIADSPSIYCIDKALDKGWKGKEKWMEMGFLAHRHASYLASLKPQNKLLDYLKKKEFSN